MSTSTAVDRHRRTRWGRLAIALVVLTGSAVTAQYASADFNYTRSVSESALTGATLSITLTEDATQVFQTALANFYPSLAYHRALDITIGPSDLKTLYVTPSDTCGSCISTTLTNDATNGLIIGIERCSVPWDGSGTPPNKTFHCSDNSGGGLLGGTKMIPGVFQSFQSANNTQIPLSTGLSSMTANTTYYYVFYWVLLSGTSTVTQNQLGLVTYTFSGTQRDATNK
jgi:hypothetical protein